MKPSDEMKHAFPQPDERFKACIRRELNDLLANERSLIAMKQSSSPKFRIGVIIACAVLLISTIAVGAAVLRYDVFDFFDRYEGAVLPEAENLVQKDVAQQGGETIPASFTLREAVYDGTTINMVVCATPSSEDILLIGADSSPNDPVSNLGISSSQTIAEYAAAQGKTKLYSLSLHDKESDAASMDWKLESDGSLVFIYTTRRESDADILPVTLHCSSVVVNADGTRDGDSIQRTELHFELQNNAIAQTEVTTLDELNVAIENAGVVVERIDLKSTALGLYYTISFRVTDPAIYDALEGGLHFRFLDENGGFIPGSPAVGGGCISNEPTADGLCVQEGALTAHEVLPDSFTLQAVSIWDNKKVLDTVTVQR